MELSSPYSNVIYALVACGLVALVVAARVLAISPRLRSWLLFVPRCLVFLILLIIFLNPVRRHEQHLPPRPASAVFLVDCSRSMALEQPVSRIQRAQSAMRTALQQSQSSPPLAWSN